MDKSGFNLKRMKTASREKSAKFRLQDEIVFSSSGKHTDAYRAVITAKRIRDRYMVSLAMTHEPSQSIVHSDSWIFKKMETCWEKYHTIHGIIEDVRDFVEVEGVKTVVAQYMVRHNLANISSEVEDMNETAVPYWRPSIDNSSKGNLAKNFPLIPFLEKTGPDKLREVYESTGTAPNPVPDGGIKGPYIYKHRRHEMGLKDVVPAPMSGFQAAALNSGVPISRTAGSVGPVKTATHDDPIGAFLKKVRDNSDRSVARGREDAVEYYMKCTGAVEDEAMKFYESVKSLCANDKVILELPSEELIRFLADGAYVPEGFDGRTYNASKAREISRALSLGIMPIRASLKSKLGGKKDTFSLVLTPIRDVAFFNGTLDRLRNPARADYAEDPDEYLYGPDDADDCRAASIIRAIPATELAGGPYRLANELVEGNKEYGVAEVLILTRITPSLVEEIVANSEDEAAKARRILDKMGKVVPVTSRDEIETVDPWESEEPEHEAETSSRQAHFQTSDRVAMKPRLNNPSLKGNVVDVSDATVAVQWDNGERHVYDMAEALMRLLPQPGEAPPVKGMVTYNLPGMDDETVLALNALGIDPVTVHALASHAKPASGKARGWQDTLKSSFRDIGLPLKEVSGYVYAGGRRPFVSKEWFEASLPEGGRLVLELGSSRMAIRAGEADDYIVPSKPLVFE